MRIEELRERALKALEELSAAEQSEYAKLAYSPAIAWLRDELKEKAA